MKRYFLIEFFLIITVIFFSACGGGSSSSSSTTPPPDNNPNNLHFVSESLVYVDENSVDALILQAVSDNSDSNITYSISGVDSAAFDLNPTTGQVTFKTAPDFETKQSYSFVATASDGMVDVTQNILINIRDVNENIPHFISAGEVNVAENQLKAINLHATDDQPITYSLSGGDSAAFNVDAKTGQVTFKTPPDYETKNIYIFTAEASDGQNVGTQNVTIHIIDIDETLPVFTSAESFSIQEKRLGSITLKATDEHPISYDVLGQDALQFQINHITGVVSFKRAPDYENKNIYKFIASASDGTNVTTQNVTINILNVDESAPNFVSSDTVTVKENQLNAITLSATDDSVLTYSISGGDSGSFDINSTSGKVTFKTAPDYEIKKLYTFRAYVTDGIFTTTQDALPLK